VASLVDAEVSSNRGGFVHADAAYALALSALRISTR
jgi:hypothetical protein